MRAEIEAHRDVMGDPRRFGSVLRHREAAADVWGWRWLDDALHDTRFAWRALRRAPGVTLVIVVTLALATGATTAIFSVVNGVVLRPLPFAAPDRLVKIHGRAWGEDRGAPDPVDGPVAPAEIEAYARSSSLDALAGYEVRTVHFADASGLERVSAATVDLGLFTLLGAEPLLGRAFRTGDSPDVAVISERALAPPLRRRSVDGRARRHDRRSPAHDPGRDAGGVPVPVSRRFDRERRGARVADRRLGAAPAAAHRARRTAAPRPAERNRASRARRQRRRRAGRALADRLPASGRADGSPRAHRRASRAARRDRRRADPPLALAALRGRHARARRRLRQRRQPAARAHGGANPRGGDAGGPRRRAPAAGAAVPGREPAPRARRRRAGRSSSRDGPPASC